MSQDRTTATSRDEQELVELAQMVQAMPRAYGERHLRRLATAVISLVDRLKHERFTSSAELSLARRLFDAAFKWQCDPHALADLDRAIEAYRQFQNAAPQESTAVRESVQTSKATEGRPADISAPAAAAPLAHSASGAMVNGFCPDREKCLKDAGRYRFLRSVDAKIDISVMGLAGESFDEEVEKAMAASDRNVSRE